MIDRKELLHRLRHYVADVDTKLEKALIDQDYWEAARLETYRRGLVMGTVFIKQMPEGQLNKP